MLSKQQGRSASFIRSLAPANPAKYGTIRRAPDGDPEVLRELFGDLAAFLRGDEELDCYCAKFFIDALERLVGERKVWDAASSEFQRRTAREISLEDQLTNRGPRVSEKTLRKLGSAFCRAFSLSKPRGRNLNQYQEVFTPEPVRMISSLRLYGASMRHAIRIVRSAYDDIDLSDRQIKEWFHRASWLKIPKPGTYGFRSSLHRRRLRLATHVLHRTVRGMDPAEAYSEVAKLAVTELCFLRTATSYLHPETVEVACEYATSCGDPTWSRVERFVRHIASHERRSRLTGDRNAHH